MRNDDELLVGSIGVDVLGTSVVMSNKDSAIRNIERGAMVIDIEWDLSHVQMPFLPLVKIRNFKLII